LRDGFQVNQETAFGSVGASSPYETRDATTLLIVYVDFPLSAWFMERERVKVHRLSDISIWGVIHNIMDGENVVDRDLNPASYYFTTECKW
jgi:hypothetical protein